MGDVAGVACPDVGVMFWPVLSFGILIGVVGGLVLSFLLISIFKGSQ
jgi:hypothetical protein